MNDGVKITISQSGLKNLKNDMAKNLQKDLQTFFNRFSRRYKGQPVNLVKQALRREWKRETGGTITDPELTQYADVISSGAKITVR